MEFNRFGSACLISTEFIHLIFSFIIVDFLFLTVEGVCVFAIEGLQEQGWRSSIFAGIEIRN